MCIGSTPQAPDPYTTAALQNQVNSEAIKTATKYNQINQNNPFGSLTYSGSYDDPNNPRTQNVNLNPDIQNILTGQTGITQGLTDAALARLGGIPQEGYTPLDDPNGYMKSEWKPQYQDNVQAGPIQNTLGDVGQLDRSFADVGGPQRSLGQQDYGKQIQDAADAVYGTQTRYVNQDFDRQNQKLEATLAAKGIPEGSQAWNDAKSQLQQQHQEALQSAQNAATTQGFNVQQGLFGQNLAAAQFGNQAQDQAFQQAAKRGDFSNEAQQAAFAQELARGQFFNQAQGQQFDQGMANAQLYNQAQQAGLDNGLAMSQYNQNEYQRRTANDIQARNQNFNELASFLNGSPISPTNPTFQPTTQYQPAQASPNAVGTANNNYSAAQQARASILGSIFGGLGTLGAAGIAACWVAREVFGTDAPTWLIFRHWMLNRAPQSLRDVYLSVGARFAEYIADKPAMKAAIRRDMEAILGA